MSTKEGEWYVLSLTVFLSRFVSQFWIYISEDRRQFVTVQWNSCAFRSQWLMGSVIFLLNQSFNENLGVLPFGACFKQREGSCLTYWVFFFLITPSILSAECSVARTNQIAPIFFCIANQSIPYQSEYRIIPVSQTNQIAALGFVSRTNQIAALGYVFRTYKITALG